jgi:hypothetical protein
VPGLNAVTENRATGAERATLARTFAELLSSETPMQQLWPRAARLLARTMDAAETSVASSASPAYNEENPALHGVCSGEERLHREFQAMQLCVLAAPRCTVGASHRA